MMIAPNMAPVAVGARPCVGLGNRWREGPAGPASTSANALLSRFSSGSTKQATMTTMRFARLLGRLTT